MAGRVSQPASRALSTQDMARAFLYVRDDCEHCQSLRQRLADDGDEVVEINVTREPRVITELLKLTAGRRIVPVLVRGGVIEVTPDGGSTF